MELLPIGETKIKIMLTKEDMDTYALDGTNVDYDNTNTRRAFWAILDEARQRTGFDAATDRVLIQLYPSRDGGAEMFVTKLGHLPPLTEKTLARGGKAAMLSCRRAVYRFDALNDLIRAARAAREEGFPASDRIFLGEDGAYYLVTEERGDTGESRFSRTAEFGDPLPPIVADYLNEHGKLLAAKDGLARFCSL